MRHIIYSLIGLVLLSGCHTIPSPHGQVMHWQRTELGFGFGLKDGSELTEAQWQKFVTEEMTPRFPEGLSMIDAHGQWRGPDGKVVRENSRMVTIYHPASDESERKIEEIRSSYVRQFQQDAVMRVDETVDIRF